MQLDIQAGEEARKFKESYKTVIMHTAVSSFVHRCQHKKALFDCFETIILLLYRFVRERVSVPMQNSCSCVVSLSERSVDSCPHSHPPSICLLPCISAQVSAHTRTYAL